MMKKLKKIDKPLPIVILSLVIIFSCSPSNDHIRIREIVLQNKVGKILINLPSELDTFYTWVDYSDDIDCSFKKKYRYSASTFPIQLESGVVQTKCPDSSYRFTISHTNEFLCESAKSRPIQYNNRILEEYISSYERKLKDERDSIIWIHKEVKIINHRSFLIVGYKKNEQICLNKQKYLSTYLKANTWFDSHLITFLFECNASDCQDFVPKMLQSVESIRIEKLNDDK